jgi:CubicO group peptidase (beta-lactamase class C family)
LLSLSRWIVAGLVVLAALVVAHDPSAWLASMTPLRHGTAPASMQGARPVQDHAVSMQSEQSVPAQSVQPASAASQPAAALSQLREKVVGGNQPAAPRVSPESELLDAQALNAAAEYAASHQSLALIVSRHGYLVFERYWSGTRYDTAVESGELARILTALAAGAAISQRSIGWPDEPIGYVLPNLSQDPRGTITVRNLLQLSSGLSPRDASQDSADIIAAHLQQPLAAKPGERWQDQSADAELLAHVIGLATQQRYAQFLSQAIWSRIGAADASLWLDHEAGAAHVDRGFIAQQGDWIRVGELITGNGRYQGDEILSPRWIPQLLQPCAANSNYGSYVRLGAHSTPGITSYAVPDTLILQGGGHRLWIIPSMQLVILRTSERPAAGDWDDARIPNLIASSARDYVPPAARPGADLRQLVPNH